MARWGWRFCSQYVRSLASVESHAGSTIVTWRRVSLFIGLPVVGYLTWKHVINAEEQEHREYFPWPHLRIRSKPFPWGDGDKSLFHNPHTNPGPEREREAEEGGKQHVPLISRLWEQYLLEDPEVRDREREAHLAYMQRRHEEYLAKKKMRKVPLQPMDIVTEMKASPRNPVSSEIDN